MSLTVVPARGSGDPKLPWRFKCPDDGVVYKVPDPLTPSTACISRCNNTLVPYDATAPNVTFPASARVFTCACPAFGCGHSVNAHVSPGLYVCDSTVHSGRFFPVPAVQASLAAGMTFSCMCGRSGDQPVHTRSNWDVETWLTACPCADYDGTDRPTYLVPVMNPPPWLVGLAAGWPKQPSSVPTLMPSPGAVPGTSLHFTSLNSSAMPGTQLAAKKLAPKQSASPVPALATPRGKPPGRPCPDCGSPTVQLFTSWACDVCHPPTRRT